MWLKLFWIAGIFTIGEGIVLFTDNEKILLVNVGDTVTGVVEDGFFKLK